VKSLTIALIAALELACATADRDPGTVRVFEINAVEADSKRALPADCRLLQAAPTFEQQASERAADDPYRRQRLETAAKGGNLLLVRSELIVNRPSLECPSADKSPGCLAGSRSWYRVTLESYGCAPETVRALEARAERDKDPDSFLSFPLAGRRVSPAQVKSRVLAMMQEGVGADVIVAYVQGQRLQKLTAEDIIDWKRSGISDDVIRAAAVR
jgi:hypothetical protein